MCGILCWDIDASSDSDMVKYIIEKIECLKHRGPDHSATQTRGRWVFAFHRLAIINLSDAGMQPIHRQELDLICNGQIYNYKELAEEMRFTDLQTDIAIIPDILRASKSIEEGLRRLDGDFAFVMRNSDDQLLVARDPIGVRPLFYGTDSSRAIKAFASEAKALIGGPNIKEVHRFPPGHYWTKDGFKQYTDIYNTTDVFLINDYDVAKNAVRDLLTTSIKKRVLHTDRPLAFLCSGGIDSCIVLAVAHQILSEIGKESEMMAFSMQYDDPRSRSDDAIYADLFLKSLGVAHTAVKFTQNDIEKNYSEVVRVCETHDPNTILAALPMFLLAKYIRDCTDYKVLLSGEVADEIMLGYNYFRQVPDSKSANEESARLIQNVHSFDLLRADRVFAAHGLEIRVPYADRDFLKFMFQTDATLRGLRNGVEKALLRDTFASLPSLRSVISRPKERASDGVGFSYVPHVFDFCCRSQKIHTGDLAAKEKAEKQHCLQIFERNNAGHAHLIIPREMPDWCQQGSSMLLSS